MESNRQTYSLKTFWPALPHEKHATRKGRFFNDSSGERQGGAGGEPG